MDSQQLSDREIDILKLVAQAKSNKEIAAQLFISVNTVKVHLANIFQKIGVASRTEAALYAINSGLAPSLHTLTPEIFESDAARQIEEVPKTIEPLSRLKLVARLILLSLAVGVILVGGFAAGRIMGNSSDSPPQNLNTVDRWQEMPELTEHQTGSSVTHLGNFLFLISGKIGDNNTSIVSRLDTQQGSWEVLNPKPTAVRDTQASILNDGIYVPGGADETGNSIANLEVFFPATGRWEERAAMPTALKAMGLYSWNNNLFVFGGLTEVQPTDSILRYEPSTDSWHYAGKLPTAMVNPTVIGTSDGLLLFGGSDSKQDSDKVFSINFNAERTRITGFEQLTSMPVVCSSCRVICASDFVFLIEKGFIWQYQITNNKWEVFSQLDEKYTQPEVIISLGNDGYLYFVGINSSDRTNVERFKLLYTVTVPVLTK